MNKEEKDWHYLKKIQNQIATRLKNNEGIITVESRTDKHVMTITIPKKGKAAIHEDDIPKCIHIS